MNKGYAFIDNGDVMHIVSDRADAARNSKNGKVLETEIERIGGYPAVDGKRIVVYSDTECYEDDNRNGGVPVNTGKKYPALAAVYRELAE